MFCRGIVACQRVKARHFSVSLHALLRRTSARDTPAVCRMKQLHCKEARNDGRQLQALSTRPFSQDECHSSTSISDRITEMVKKKNVVIFMKGVPDAPMCGFSNAVVQVFRMHGVEDYDAHNVLEDDELRQGIKDYSDWPTIPQVYFDGEFVGGCDILLQMHQSGELVEELEKLGIKSELAK